MNVRQPGSVSLDLPADLQYLQVPGACLDALLETEPDDVVYKLKLAVYETCTNIVRHSYGIGECTAEEAPESRIHVVFTVMFEPAALAVDLYDTGSCFDMRSAPEPDLSEPQTEGYGLYLARQLVDELLYEREPGRNHWRLTKHL